MTVARFPVYSQLDSAGGAQRGTVEIDRDTKTFIVRPHRRHKTYELPLNVVADLVCKTIILAEIQEKKRARKAARRTRAA